MDEVVVAGGANGLLKKIHGLERAAFNTRYLGADQGGAVFEVLRAILRIDLKLSVVGGQSLDMPLPLVSGSRVAARGARQGAIEMMLRRFFEGRHENPR